MRNDRDGDVTLASYALVVLSASVARWLLATATAWANPKKESLKTLLYKELDERCKKELSSRGSIRLDKDKIMRKQQKLFEARYADAIPLDLLK